MAGTFGDPKPPRLLEQPAKPSGLFSLLSSVPQLNDPYGMPQGDAVRNATIELLRGAYDSVKRQPPPYDGAEWWRRVKAGEKQDPRIYDAPMAVAGTVRPVGNLLNPATVDLIKRPGIWELSKIETPPELRGQGFAEAKLKEVLEQADEVGVPVALTPSSDFGASKGRLEKWYKKHGFVHNSGRNKDFTTRETLIRPASSKRPMSGGDDQQ